MGSAPNGDERKSSGIAFAAILAFQVFLATWGIADQWTRGHNGWSGATQQHAARETLRWQVPLPLQYEGHAPEEAAWLAFPAPPALHLHNVVSVALFGDSELSIRLVAAFWSVASLCMLFAVVRRLWDDAHAIAAAAIYVALPVNAIYTNMSNHAGGFVFWALLTVYLYVRAPPRNRWPWPAFLSFLAAFTLAATWDWPAYTVAACLGLHWAIAARNSQGLLQVATFGLWVMTLFVGHFALFEAVTGSFDELIRTFDASRGLRRGQLRTLFAVVPELMFTGPVLGLCVVWLVALALRLVKGVAHRRDLLPLAFVVAGAVHYWTFPASALTYSYWSWPMLPGVAIVVAICLFAMGRWVRERAGLAASFSVLLLVVPLVVRVAQIVPPARHVGGSMGFVSPIRGAIEAYDSGRAELRLAERVKTWTDRKTGVQLHPSLEPRGLDSRFDVTLDRVTHRWSSTPLDDLPDWAGVTGWVFVAAVDEFTERERTALAARHPYRQFGEYFMVDLRRGEPEIEVWGLTPSTPSLRWWLLHSAFEPPVRASRLIAAEQTLRRQVMERQAR